MKPETTPKNDSKLIVTVISGLMAIGQLGIVNPVFAAATLNAPFCNTSENAPSLRPFPEAPASLKCVPLPVPTLDAAGTQSLAPSILKSGPAAKAALIVLGKALFWDQQVGSDGLACASCHYKAGADDRVKNQINPGGRNASGKFASDGATPIGNVFNYAASNPEDVDPLLPGEGKGPNYTLKKSDFPLRKYQERNAVDLASDGFPPQKDRNAAVIYDSDDVVSSQGVYRSQYHGLAPGGQGEDCTRSYPASGPEMPLFNVQGVSVRQVEPRNAPTTINAVFNFRSFWDGRANNVFNGLDPFGLRRPFPSDADIQTWDAKKKAFVRTPIAIYNASLASQAVGPALSDFEMSCAGKTFRELGKKMLKAVPLKLQMVRKDDSVLGRYAAPVIGLKTTYTALIKAAFADRLWSAPAASTVGGYQQMENNFSLFWGLAIQAYEATLVSDDSRFDQIQEGRVALSNPPPPAASEARGITLFLNKGCAACHLGPEFTAASVTHVSNPNDAADIGKFTERMIMGDGGIAIYDTGFYNIGVRPTEEDVGVGGSDPYGNPLSFTRVAKRWADGINPFTPTFPDPFANNASTFASELGCIVWNEQTTPAGLLCGTSPIAADERDAVDGAFKAPTLRNVELTGPYFHNGGQATLEQVMEFYNRGGDRVDHFQKDNLYCNTPVITVDGFGNPMVAPDPATGLIDSTGYNGQPSNLSADMAGGKVLNDSNCQPEDLNMTNQDIADLVAFMKSLTDQRVRMEKAPFDHPSLIIPDGHVGDELAVTAKPGSPTIAGEMYKIIPAVGKNGRSAAYQPLLPFEAGLKD